MAAIAWLALSTAAAFGAEPPAGAAPALPPGVRLFPNLRYAAVDGISLLLDLYLPASDKPIPVIVCIHGGGWNSGDKRDAAPLLLAAHGYALASINYRLSQQAHYPAQIEDCKAAVRWIRAHGAFYGIDPLRVGAWGYSAGGNLAALLGTSTDVKALEGNEGNLDQSSRVEAVVDWFGRTDFLVFARQMREAGMTAKVDPDSAQSVMGQLLGGAVQEKKAAAIAANPITYITKDCPPFLIEHGDRDPLVPLAQSRLLYDALRKAGVEAELVAVPGAGHGFSSPEPQRKMLAFFDRHLKPAPATQPERQTP